MMSLLEMSFFLVFLERWDLLVDSHSSGAAFVVVFGLPVERLGCSLPGVTSMASAAFALGLVVVASPELDIVLTLVL